MKKTLYTAIIGNYDRLLPVPVSFRTGWELKCFTDQKGLKSEDWQIIPVERGSWPAVAMARRIKILGQEYVPEGEIYIWLDASLEITGNLDDFLKEFGGEDFVLFRHPRRDCVYAEITACRKKRKADPGMLERQKKAYLEMRYPARNGLMMTGFLMRRNSDRVKKMNENWWLYTAHFKTWRDQLTLPLAISRSGWHPAAADPLLAAKYFRQEVFHKGTASEADEN